MPDNSGKTLFLTLRSRSSTRLNSLGTVLRASLLPVFHTGGIECSSNDVIADARKIFDSAASDQHHGVLLQVVADTGNVGGNFDTIGEANPGDFS